MMTGLTVHEALIHLMVIMSASDRDMRDAELARIGAIVSTLPVFHGFDRERTLAVAQETRRLLHEDAGLDGVLDRVRAALEPGLRELAYALAVDVAAADMRVGAEEMRVLDIVKARFGIDALAAAAIERAASIRHRSA